MRYPIVFRHGNNKTKLAPAPFFLFFKELFLKKYKVYITKYYYQYTIAVIEYYDHYNPSVQASKYQYLTVTKPRFRTKQNKSGYFENRLHKNKVL